jgi:hypothetical protein
MIDHTTGDTSNQRREPSDQTTHQSTFDPKTGSGCGTIISAIATLNTIGRTELAIFSDSVNPDTQ